MPIRYEKGIPGEDYTISDRAVMGPSSFYPGNKTMEFDDVVHVGEGEVAVCYLDIDAFHHQAHWAIGPFNEIVQWLMDEAAVSARKRMLITMLGIRVLAVTAHIPPEPARAFEQTIAVAVEREAA